jgi:hypothetical protein
MVGQTFGRSNLPFRAPAHRLKTLRATVRLHSTREDAGAWWNSASATIFQALDRVSAAPPELEQMILHLFDAYFTPGWRDHDASVAAYLRHNDEVRARVPTGRLVEWQPGDGWGPICAALGMAEPDEPFPHVNTTADFRVMAGLDRSV